MASLPEPGTDGSPPGGDAHLKASEPAASPQDRPQRPQIERAMPDGDVGTAPMLFYVVDWLPPDFGAVGQYATIFARERAENGCNVCLLGLTSGASRTVTEVVGTRYLEIRRLSAAKYNKTGIVSRLLWSAKTNLRLCLELVRDPRSRGAEVLFTGSPPFMLFFIFIAKWVRGARLTYRITDFYPEVLIAAWGKRALPLVLLQRFAWVLRRRVERFEALGEDQRRLLIGGGINAERIALKRDLSPISFTGSELPAELPAPLAGRKVLLYSGNLGIPHDVETAVGGLARHHVQGPGEFGLWLNASGSRVAVMVEQLQRSGIPFVHTKPVPLEKLAALMLAADAHLITMQPGFSGLVVPSKLYACLDSLRPILFVGPKSSDVHLLCSQRRDVPYEQVDPGDIGGFAHALDRLSRAVQTMKIARSRHQRD